MNTNNLPHHLLQEDPAVSSCWWPQRLLNLKSHHFSLSISPSPHSRPSRRQISFCFALTSSQVHNDLITRSLLILICMQRPSSQLESGTGPSGLCLPFQGGATPPNSVRRDSPSISCDSSTWVHAPLVSLCISSCSNLQGFPTYLKPFQLEMSS